MNIRSTNTYQRGPFDVGAWHSDPELLLTRRDSVKIEGDASRNLNRICESRQHAHRERTGFLPLSAPRGRGGRVDIVISDAAVGCGRP